MTDSLEIPRPAIDGGEFSLLQGSEQTILKRLVGTVLSAGAGMNALLALRDKSSLIPATRFSLTIGKFILGRSSKCDLVVEHETVSRRHAEIVLTRQKTTVRDLGSRNGTFIDDKRVLTGDLQTGQYVRFGSVAFLLTMVPGEEDDSDSEIETEPCGISDPVVHDPRQALSEAQRRVLKLILEGSGEKKIAAQLHLSPTTIHNHIQAIYRALNVHSRSELLILLLAKSADQNATLS